MNEQKAIEKMQFLIDAYIELAKQEKVEITLLSGCICIKGEGNFATETYTELIQACLMAKNALEKQIGKKPEYGGLYACPNCKSLLLQGSFESKGKCCKHCGQLLDWGE